MLANGLGHCLFFSRRQGIFFPHYPLEFREFVDHLGDQVRLGQAGCPLSPGLDPGLGPQMFRQPARKADKPLHLVADAAQALQKDHTLQSFPPGSQGELLILGPEKGGVVQPGTQHLFIAGANGVQMFPGAAPDGDKSRQQRAGCIRHGKIALMLPHGSNEHFRRQLHIFLINAAVKGGGILHQVSDLFQEFIIFRNLASMGGGQFRHLLADKLPALVLVGNDPGLLQPGQVLAWFLNGYGLQGQETVAPGAVAGLDAAKFQGQHLAAEESQQPANGTGKAELAAAPAHGFGEG